MSVSDAILKRESCFYRWSNQYWKDDEIELTGVTDFQV